MLILHASEIDRSVDIRLTEGLFVYLKQIEGGLFIHWAIHTRPNGCILLYGQFVRIC